MQIDRIRLSNFKSISELDLNFQEMNGLWEISGAVGVGKTTIGEAIIYGLFGSVRGKTNESLISWGKKHALVETWVYCKNTHVYIRREINAYGQSPLTATADGEEIIASDKRSIQGILENEWFDIPRQTLELLCVISFNNFKSLSTLNTQESRDFLNSTISFDKLTSYEEWCKEQIKTINTTIFQIESDKRAAHASLDTIDRLLPEIPTYVSLDAIDNLIKKKTDEFKAVQETNRKELKRLNRVADCSVAEHRVVVGKIKELKKSIKQLSGATCPLCGQPIDEKHKEHLQQELSALEIEESRLNEISEKDCKAVLDFQGDMGARESKLDNTLTSLNAERFKTKQYTEIIKRHKMEKERHNQTIVESDKKLEGLKRNIQEYQEMIDFIRDTVRPTIISSIIPSINIHIDHYLKLAHQNYIINYDENFKCMMKNPYGELMPISSLSTGQKKVIDMIIILAFIKTFITQIDFNLYFLDELIGNIDADLRDTMCGLLRDTLDKRDVMFLISHSPINQQYLDGVIKVEMHAGISEYSIINIAN
jgi:DNA repair exonuclease SbcCD ATPase subunit